MSSTINLRATGSWTVGLLLVVGLSALSMGCGTTSAITTTRALGEIRLLGQAGQGAEFHGDSDVRRGAVVAADGRCALYELDSEELDNGELDGRTLLGQRRIGEGGAVSRDRVASWAGEPTSDGVERAMVFAPGDSEQSALAPDGVRVGMIFTAPQRRSAPWLLECSVPQTGSVGLPESLLVAIFATGREVRSCTHDLCTISEQGLIPMRGPTGEDRRVALRAMSVEVRAVPDASAELARRRGSERVAVVLDLSDAPPELRVDAERRELARRRDFARTRVVLGEALAVAD